MLNINVMLDANEKPPVGERDSSIGKADAPNERYSPAHGKRNVPGISQPA
jgi:hypothetical protein